jgi:hypothetical protein
MYHYEIKGAPTPADAFIHAGIHLQSACQSNPSVLGIATMVNAAFAAELAIKRQLKHKSVRSSYTHNLLTLFSKLDQLSQSTVIAGVSERFPLLPGSFMQLLEQNAKAFEEWRYIHDRPITLGNSRFLLLLAIEVRKLHP